MTNFEKSPHKTNSNNSGATLSSWSRQQKIAMIAGFVILGTAAQLGALAWSADEHYASSPANPYVYAQTSDDLLKLVED